MHRLHGLVEVDALQVDRGHAQVAVSDLASDDVERDALPQQFERVREAQLMRAKRRRTPARAASPRSAALALKDATGHLASGR
jgi:hypothetical protein